MSTEAEPSLIVVVGPTATGKTSLGLEIARRIDGEIVGADAYQIYRGMDIGTAKPTPEELVGVVHHLIDVADPDEHFDAHRYVELADEAIAAVSSRGKDAIIVGGTGLYIRALVRGLADMPGASPKLRAELAERSAAEGPEALHRELSRVDPVYADMIGERDLVRITRALEVYLISGRPISEIHAEHRNQPDRYRSIWFGLDPGREALRDRISLRTEAMFEAGFVEEVKNLAAAGYGPELAPMRALGYRAVHQHIADEVTLEEARRLTVRDTARYSRRQRNWFRSEEREIHWIDGFDGDVEARLAGFLRSPDR